MVKRLGRSAARASRSTPTPRKSAPTSPKLGLRSRFRKAHPVTPRWRGQAPGPSPLSGGGASSLRCRLVISSDYGAPYRTFTTTQISADQLEEMARVAALIPTNEQLAEAEAEALREAEDWGRAREEAIREQVGHEFTRLHAEADEFESAAYGPERLSLLYQARRLRADADELRADGDAQMREVAEQVRERRDEIRAELKKSYEHDEKTLQQLAADAISDYIGFKINPNDVDDPVIF